MKIIQSNSVNESLLRKYKGQMRIYANDEPLINRRYKIKYKGQILSAKLGNIDLDTLYLFRKNQTKDKIQNINFEDCLLEYSDELSYCKESNKVYINIDKDVSEYLDKYECSDLIYRLASKTTTMIPLSGEIVKIYDTFIKKEKVIRTKKSILLNNNEDTNTDVFWVLRYLEKSYVKKTTVKLNYKDLQWIRLQAQSNNVIYSELLYRYSLNLQDKSPDSSEGLCMKHAMDYCKAEVEKYGLKYEDYNDNFIAYIKYLAKQEEIKGDNK